MEEKRPLAPHEQLTMAEIEGIESRLTKYLQHPKHISLEHPYTGEEFMPNRKRLAQHLLHHLQYIFIGERLVSAHGTPLPAIHIRWERYIVVQGRPCRNTYGTASPRIGRICLSKRLLVTRGTIVLAQASMAI
jgi:hypothetical protein